uniref:BRF2-like C-terminal domain-containing protein n=1 Tax=Ciona savignyi TaxID=51511 RepID=H2YV35_CIOSA
MLCESCKVGHLVKDSIGVQVVWICEECGVEGKYLGDFQHEAGEPGSHGSLEMKYRCDVGESKEKQRKRHLRKYYSEIENSMNQFAPGNTSLYETAELFFTNTSGTKVFHSSRHPVKIKLAACCVFLALRVNNCPVTIDAICRVMGTEIAGVAKVLQQARCILEENPGRFDLSQIEGEFKIIEEMRNNPALVKKAKEIIQVLDLMFISTGRKTENVALAAAYLAIVSQQSKQRKCMTVTNFCLQNHINYEKVASIIKDCKSRILELNSRLPWNKNAPPSNTSFHMFIDDIIKHQQVFTMLPMNEGKVEGCDNSNVEDDAFLPPCYIPRRPMRYIPSKRTYDDVSTSETPSEADIPDSEMCQYIRSATEVKNA